ncbi:SgcJ/EcaC family oxidoreductase [Nocardia brasiliensis]|uniref:SgcJ/EcaC family oxidoreductase n=1 Tax=Nocardia brasiliensis TaxID=37326 RepID=UPI00366B2368
METNEILRALEQGWHSGDGAAFAAPFAEDVTFIDVLGRVQQGRSVVANEHQKLFDTIYRGSKWRIRVEKTRNLSDRVVVLNTISELFVPDGPRAGTTANIQTVVLVDGEIAYFHNTIRTQLADFAQHDSALAALSPLDWTRD